MNYIDLFMLLSIINGLVATRFIIEDTYPSSQIILLQSKIYQQERDFHNDVDYQNNKHQTNNKQQLQSSQNELEKISYVASTFNFIGKIGRVKDTIYNWKALRHAKQLKGMTKGDSGIRITMEEIIDRFGSEIDWRKGYEKLGKSRTRKELIEEIEFEVLASPI